MKKSLPARPNLEHLRSQARQLLARLRDGDAAAAQTFIDHLPAAKRMTPAQVRRSGLRLADAQSAIARQSGFAAWPGFARHVEQLRAWEGEWPGGLLRFTRGPAETAGLGPLLSRGHGGGGE